MPVRNRLSNNGIVFNIQRYSLHDGPGIRSVVFLKGCPLRCRWCCNPESFVLHPQITFSGTKCIQCERCYDICPQGISPDERIKPGGNSRCTLCSTCVEECPSGALEMAGREMTVDEVVAEVEKDRQFYDSSSGGVTLSGGEVLLQWQFAAKLLRAFQLRSVHTAIETSGYGKWEHLQSILDYADLLLFDIKHMNAEKHKDLTGVVNTVILENARRAAVTKCDMIIRVPLIPGKNDDLDDIELLAKFANEIGVMKLHLLSYHRLGESKYDKLGIEYTLSGETLPEIQIEMVKDFLAKSGLEVVVSGG